MCWEYWHVLLNRLKVVVKVLNVVVGVMVSTGYVVETGSGGGNVGVECW